jgi:hypothetical protein
MLGDHPKNDFNGDGRSDLIWTNGSGYTSTWSANANGGFDPNWWVIQFNYTIVDVADFTNKGREQVLVQNNAFGGVILFQFNSFGLAIDYNYDGGAPLGNPWTYLDATDVNGDHYADILTRRNDGWFVNWVGRTDGTGHQVESSWLYFAPDWHIVSTGDFNGDGKADILLRSDAGWVTNWLGKASNSFTNNGANTSLFFDTNWFVVGTGDFNGDGLDDLLLRSGEGWVTNWLATANGGFTNNGANATTFLPTDWGIQSIGDFNGDGKDDLIVRHEDGWVTEWLGTANGSFSTSGNLTTFVAPDRHIQDDLVWDPFPNPWDY